MASPSYPGSRSIKSPYPRFEFGISSLSDGWSMDIKIFFGIVVVVVEVVTVVDGEVVVVEVVVEGVVLVIVVSIIVSSTALSVSIEHAIKKSMKIKDLFIILKIKNY
jgi:hypothetical protein